MQQLVRCANCLVHVIPSARGICPCCHKPFVPLADRSPARDPSKPPVVVDTAISKFLQTVADATNPYQAPPAWPEDTKYDVESPFAQPHDIAWVLFQFRGRIPRRTFWGWSVLVMVMYYAAIVALVVILDAVADREFSETTFLVFYIPLVVLMIWTNVAIQVKRWHDHDKSGWWWFICMIPFVGPVIVLAVLGCMRGTFGHNAYGPDPT